MRRKLRKTTILISGALFFVLSTNAQSVTELGKASKAAAAAESSSSSSSGSSSSGSSYSSGDGDGIGGALFLFEAFYYLFVGTARGIGAFAEEEIRLAKLNKTQNHYYRIEAGSMAGYGPSGEFFRISPQATFHAGALSFDFRQTRLNDAKTEFITLDFTTWMNFVNKPNFTWRVGLGNVNFQYAGSNYFTYGTGFDFQVAPRWRIDVMGNLTREFRNSEGIYRPRQEFRLRGSYDLWQKGHLKASLLAGYQYQKYFSSQDFQFSTFDAGVRLTLAFSKYQEKLGTR